MSQWFVYFLIYSFAGYGLEKLHARLSHSPRQVRKCFLLLPLCPVYGLAMTALLALAPERIRLIPLLLLGGAVCTGIEYLVHLFYDKVLGVWFWDYRPMRGHIQGRICPLFSVIWGGLSAAAVRWVQPSVQMLAERMPAWAVFALWMIFAADCVLSWALLRQNRDTELLTVHAVLAQMRASSQSSTS
ncbi:MAG: putative ABC transporter permease [Oscillospiraceae bacterium]|nr:putative ABC transporter permease [Oscillospiraceae bacterium]